MAASRRRSNDYRGASGDEYTALSMARNLIESMGWSAEQTMDNMRIPEAQKRELLSLL